MATKSRVEAELKRLVEEAVSYEERASLRKLLRSVKKGALEPSEALQLVTTSSDDGIDTKVQQSSNEREEHKVQNTKREVASAEEQDDVNQVNQTLTGKQFTDQRDMDEDTTCESSTDEQRLTIKRDMSESSPDEPLTNNKVIKETTTCAAGRSEARPTTKGHKPPTSDHSEDLLDSGKPQGRRWTVSGAQPKSERSSESQKPQPDAPFGQSMLKKTDLKPTRPAESTTEVPFGPSTLRRVGSKDSDDAKAHLHEMPSENPYEKVILRQTSREVQPVTVSQQSQNIPKTDSLYGKFALQKRSTDDHIPSRRVAVDDSTRRNVESPFGKVVLRQTSRDELKQPSTSTRMQDEQSASQFGVVLKKTKAKQEQPQRAGLNPTVANRSIVNKDHGSVSSSVRPRASTVSTCRSTEVKRSTKQLTDNPVDIQVSAEDLKVGLAMYINKELARHKALSHLLPVPLTGNGLYRCCSDAFLLCKLINLSVRGTVDERALSRLEGSREKKQQANTDNLTLALESARSIGCQIDDSTISAVSREDKSVITQLLVDLLKARAVHSKEADQFGSHVFSSPSVLLSLFGVRVSDHKMQSHNEKDEVDAMSAETASTSNKPAPIQKDDARGIGLQAKQKQNQPQDVKHDETSSGSYIPDDVKQPPSVLLMGDERDEQEVLKGPDGGSKSYESRAAARKAAREKRRAEKK